MQEDTNIPLEEQLAVEMTDFDLNNLIIIFEQQRDLQPKLIDHVIGILSDSIKIREELCRLHGVKLF